MSEPSVKCRHCGEEIERCQWVSKSTGFHCCSEVGDQWHEPEPPIRTVLSAEDRERLEQAIGLARCYADGAPIVSMIRRVLANAGGGE